MGWSELGSQFCLEIAFGVLLALAFVPKAPVGLFFYRIMGTTALVPILVALALLVGVAGVPWSDGAVLGSGLAVLAYPVISGPVRGRRWAAGLALALLGTAVAVLLLIRRAGGNPQAPDATGAGELLLGTLSALATGSVAGSVSLAMVLGHWYLTVPNLAVKHLQRLNRVTVWCMVASLVLVAATCLAFTDLANANGQPLLGATGLFYLGTRVAVGLVFPLGFAWMTASSLRFQNTRSATGILYASTVLVLIGAAVSVSLQDSYGVPL